MTARHDLHRIVDDLLDADPKLALIASRRLVVDELPWIEGRAVALARREGWSWAPIARLLGRSRQAVRQRFDTPALSTALRPDPHLAKHRYESGVAAALADIRREDDDDPVAW